MSDSVWEAISNVRELSRVTPGCTGMVRTPSWMSGSCRVSLLDVREALPVVQKWSEGPLGCP